MVLEPRSMLSVLVIDDQPVFRLGLRHLLSANFPDVMFGEAETAREALLEIDRRRWEVVTLAISTGGENGFHILREIRRRHPEVKVLIISSHQERMFSYQLAYR